MQKYLIQCTGVLTKQTSLVPRPSCAEGLGMGLEASVTLTISGHELLFISLDFMIMIMGFEAA